MREVWVFRHIDCEGPGYLADCLSHHAWPVRLIAIDEGAAVPDNLDGAAGLVFMGGSMSVNDDLAWIEPELALIRAAAAAGLPVLGHCLGGQLMAKALGAKVSKQPQSEIGWHEVWRSADVSAAWAESLPARFLAYHWHGETFDLPPGSELLLSSEGCQNQAFALGRMLALQCHVEMTGAMIREWVERYGASLTASRDPWVQGGEAMLENIDARVDALQAVAGELYARWIGWLQR